MTWWKQRVFFYLENEMSRRFGRNQKRKMREELACKQQALTRAEGLMRCTTAEKDRLVDTLSEARYILGDNVALPPEMRGNHPRPLGGDWDAAPWMKLGLREFTSTAAMAPTSFQRMRMHTLLVDWEDKTKTDDHVHIRSMLDNGKVVYSLSNAALYGMPRDALQALLTREVSRSIAQLMVEKLRPTTAQR